MTSNTTPPAIGSQISKLRIFCEKSMPPSLTYLNQMSQLSNMVSPMIIAKA